MLQAVVGTGRVVDSVATGRADPSPHGLDESVNIFR